MQAQMLKSQESGTDLRWKNVVVYPEEKSSYSIVETRSNGVQRCDSKLRWENLNFKERIRCKRNQTFAKILPRLKRKERKSQEFNATTLIPAKNQKY